MTFMNLPRPGGQFEWRSTARGPILQCLPLLEIARHGFTTRALVLKDDASEWAAVAEFMQVDVGCVRLIRQVHGAGVTLVRKGNIPPPVAPEADVIVSDDPAVAIGVRVADCAPILLADHRLGVVAAAHAGWRGTVQRAARAAVEAMTREFGSVPADLVAAIGPCLGACCGEVGEEVVRAFEEAGHRNVERWFGVGPTPRPYLDLARANVDQLVESGIAPEHVHVAGLCTKTHSRVLHSYRAQAGAAGRMVGIIRAATRVA